ncbi:hypothetical protein CLTEP_19210 [Clostridium tepidiprofundi DSM 19306]|uniref:YhfM-like domain-containing protein n=1 Tax=Clostridium tepidiprofundi DSM 19306 TaxID=1121338 RepID=A0A151B2K8_9CLOT|nr:hypothetical protein [Clostridium tepidiprofundi]KYH34144.1 hypothetical protein CLTEP_19210 [Clostridium tepidiprofundi DSM 19306]
MNQKRIILFLIIIFTMLFMGCSRIDTLKVKVGLKNNDFENIRQGRVKKIVIQSTRDKAFRFSVTDKSAIYDLYEILSSAKKVDNKSKLQPDYIFEMYERGGKVYKFNYIAGLDKSDNGNFYSDDNVYIVSSRLDNDIIRNFWNIRKPRNFKYVYYNSILAVLDKYLGENDRNKSIVINLKEDIEVAKFVLSTDLEDFKNKLNEHYKNIELNEDNSCNTVITVKTEGYKSTVYKSLVKIKEKDSDSEKKYYVWAKYSVKDKIWSIQVYENNKPKDF